MRRSLHIEIECKLPIPCLPEGYDAHPFHQTEQAYLYMGSVVRIRQEDDNFYLTYEGKELLSREEYNLPLVREAYTHLLSKADGVVLTKKRYFIPPNSSDHLATELDVFEGRYAGLLLAEVEFTPEKEVVTFQTPKWFGRDVTFIGEYQNSRLACGK